MRAPIEPRAKKYIEIAAQIKKDILSGRYPEGQNIPAIRKLSELYGVNPQTVNKATAYLASLGFLKPRQGSGSLVCLPEPAQKELRGISMLIDQRRSRLLSNLDDVSNYHGKDIYLAYLLEMSRRGLPPGFIVYDQSAEELAPEFPAQAAGVSGFVVQGLLPGVYVRFLETRGIPTVFINREIPAGVCGRFGSIMITNDQLPGIVNYLVSLGHEKILYLLSLEFDENEVFKERLRAVKDAVGAWPGKVEVEVFRYQPGGPETVDGFRKLHEAGFSAAIGYNDASALGLYPVLHHLGLHCPRDFSLVGFDDILASRMAAPPLTTVRVNRQRLTLEALGILEALGVQATSGLIRRDLPTELVIRKSASVRQQVSHG